jgi:predicted aldo/keto reductase-like oxidoreductase
MARSLDEETGRLTRRRLLRGVAAAGAVFAFPRSARGEEPKKPAAPLPARDFGATGRRVSTFGLGCYPVGAVGTESAGVAVVREALDLGCTYLDTAPSYGTRGASEKRVGIALEKRRDGVFLATKTLERTRAGARRDLEESLKRLRTDRVDLIQVHCVRDLADLERVLGDDGPLPALLEAKERGTVRHVGITVHTDPAVAKAALERYAWDAVLVPLNPVDPHHLSFAETLPVAKKRNVARVGMKVFASGNLLKARPGYAPIAAEDCLRYAFSLDVSTTIVGCSSLEEVRLAARIAAEGKPLAEERRKQLVAAAKPVAGLADVEWYKRHS